MQRILRDEGHVLVDPQQPAHRQALIHRYCPPSIGHLFATPREGRTGGLEWWTELPGQPRRLDELTGGEQAALKARLSQRLAALEGLIAELERRGDPAAAELRALPMSPAPDTLYSVGGEPLLIRWTPIASKPGATQAPTPTRAAVPRAPAPARRQRRCVLPLWLPLLGAMALLGLWLALYQWDRLSFFWPGHEEPVEPFACRDDDVPPPEFVAIFDTSGSMNLNISASKEDEQWFFGMPELVRAMRTNDARVQRLMASPSRLEVAQDAFAELVGAIDPGIDIGLVTYRGCGVPVVQGNFTAAQRPKLIDGVLSLKADDGTPLAASLRRAAEMVDGVDRDAVILAFVDGADGCNENQCEVARDIASRQPRLRVNVVDISGSGLSNCIAEQTGGRVFGSQDTRVITGMLKDAGREALNATYCST